MTAPNRPFTRVALEASALSRPGSERGLGRYTTACVTAAHLAADEVVAIKVPERLRGRLAEFGEAAERSLRLHRSRVDLFHATTPYAMALTRRPTVASILDVIPLDVASHRQTGVKARAFFKFAARADAVLTISDFSATRIHELLGYPADRIFVGPLPPLAVFSPSTPKLSVATPLDEPFALCLLDMATPDPRKRSHLLSRLARRLGESGVRLVIVGAATEVAFAQTPNIEPRGRIDDAALAELLRRCTAFCYFSAYEGQGLPPLEAMASGAPVVAMSNSAVTEIVGSAGHLIEEPGDPWNADIDPQPWMDDAVDEMAEVVAALASSDERRGEARRRSLERAAEFTQGRFNTVVANAYEAVR